MPLYMDRHDVSEAVTAEIVAELHQKDLKVQHKFGCRGLTYWFDDHRKTAFCLIEAPDAETVKSMHDNAHGEVPHQIIEVDPSIVESFLGRIEDPQKATKTKLNIINDPAFRTIMYVELFTESFDPIFKSKYNCLIEEYQNFIHQISPQFGGRLVRKSKVNSLISFESVTSAIECAMAINYKFKDISSSLKVKIGVSAGVPVTNQPTIFEATISSAVRLCKSVNAAISVSAEVKELYESENHTTTFDSEIKALTEMEEEFLIKLMEYLNQNGGNSDLKVGDISRELGISKSQLYRNMTELLGKSPNLFIKEFRLNKAFFLLHKNSINISQTAFNTGFNSPSYFTKCFINKYGILPSECRELEYSFLPTT